LAGISKNQFSQLCPALDECVEGARSARAELLTMTTNGTEEKEIQSTKKLRAVYPGADERISY